MLCNEPNIPMLDIYLCHHHRYGDLVRVNIVTYKVHEGASIERTGKQNY